jgi:hypothetical protein
MGRPTRRGATVRPGAAMARRARDLARPSAALRRPDAGYVFTAQFTDVGHTRRATPRSLTRIETGQ